MPKVTFFTEKGIVTAECPSGICITEAAAIAGVTVVAPCGGKGICGNCRVLASGELSAPTSAELSFLRDSVNSGYRLACMAYINGDCTVSTVTGTNLSANKNIKPSIKTAPVTDNKKCVAAAIDIGTTTVLIDLYSLPDGKVIDHAGFLNPQCNYGADVITRLEYCIKGGQSLLTKLINESINNTFKNRGVNPEFCIIAGNTAMLHIAAGKDARGLANYPFTPETLFGEWIGNRYYMRCASAYIGGDAVASLLASGITDKLRTAVLSDIGTNNETILFDGISLYACSSAAGPAFEGAHISCGMPAVSGAITKVKIDGNGVKEIKTIDNAIPRGFCGSGLISALDELYYNGYLSPSGDVLTALPDFKGIELLPEDIAQLQLAKSAVLSGITTLEREAGLDNDLISVFVPAGSFGSNADMKAAERISMIPPAFADKAVRPVSAIEGAGMLLLNAGQIKKSEKLAESIKTVELANNTFFADEFISNMYFPFPDDEGWARISENRINKNPTDQ